MKQPEEFKQRPTPGQGGDVRTITADNVNDALQNALWWMRVAGLKEDSRNGPVMVSPGPVVTVFRRPWQRVLFWPIRDANPYFHLMEAMWMLGGRNDVAFISQFSSNIRNYSDDGQTFHGAYGFRWRNLFGHDQLDWAVNHLKTDPTSRRCTVGMFSPSYDHLSITKDVPCNLMVTFDLRQNVLNMTVFNRSNDIVWGLYGANAVHFSYLQEYMAGRLRVPMGVYRHFSNNFHIYEPHWKLLESVDDSQIYAYTSRRANSFPMFWTAQFEENLHAFLDGTKPQSTDMYFENIVFPMYRSWMSRKGGGTGLKELERMPQGSDWKIAATEWILRRENSSS